MTELLSSVTCTAIHAEPAPEVFVIPPLSPDTLVTTIADEQVLAGVGSQGAGPVEVVAPVSAVVPATVVVAPSGAPPALAVVPTEGLDVSDATVPVFTTCPPPPPMPPPAPPDPTFAPWAHAPTTSAVATTTCERRNKEGREAVILPSVSRFGRPGASGRAPMGAPRATPQRPPCSSRAPCASPKPSWSERTASSVYFVATRQLTLISLVEIA